MKTKYYLFKAIYNFKKNFLKYLSITTMTIAILLIFYVISTIILVSNDDLFNSLYGYIVFVITAVIICLLLNPILEAYVFAIDVGSDQTLKTENDSSKDGSNIITEPSYFRNFRYGLKHKLRIKNRSSIKVLNNVVRSVFIYLILFVIWQYITLYVLSITDETVNNLYNLLLNGLATEEQQNELFQIIANSVPFAIGNFFSLLISFLSFFYFLFIYLFKSSLGNSYYTVLKPNRLTTVNKTYKDNRKVFLKPYLVILSGILFIFSVVFALCYFSLYFFTSMSNFIFITETSLFIGIIFILLFVPCIFELYKALKITFNVYFMMSFIPFMKSYLNDLTNDNYEIASDIEKEKFIRKLCNNDLHQVLTFGNLYYLQLDLEYDIYEKFEDFVDEKEMNLIRAFMNTNQSIKEEIDVNKD